MRTNRIIATIITQIVIAITKLPIVNPGKPRLMSNSPALSGFSINTSLFDIFTTTNLKRGEIQNRAYDDNRMEESCEEKLKITKRHRILAEIGVAVRGVRQTQELKPM